jgi:hypothetical protein
LIGSQLDQWFAEKENTECHQKKPENQLGVFELQFRAQECSKDYAGNTRDPQQQEQSPPHVPSEKNEFRGIAENVQDAG